MITIVFARENTYRMKNKRCAKTQARRIGLWATFTAELMNNDFHQTCYGKTSRRIHYSYSENTISYRPSSMKNVDSNEKSPRNEYLRYVWRHNALESEKLPADIRSDLRLRLFSGLSCDRNWSPIVKSRTHDKRISVVALWNDRNLHRGLSFISSLSKSGFEPITSVGNHLD